MSRLASQSGSTPLITASRNGRWEVVDRLIAARASVNAADEVVSPPPPLHHPPLKRS